MKLKIHDPGPDAWDKIVSECDYATFFHSRAWSEVICRTFPHLRDASKLIELPDGRTVVFPILRSSVGFHHAEALHSMWPGVYGGPVSQSPLAPSDFEAVFRAVFPVRGVWKPLPRRVLLGSPLQENVPPSIIATDTLRSYLVPLDGGIDKVWANASSEFRRKVRQSEKAGVSVHRASEREHIMEYFSVYEDSLRRWGERATSRYPRALFENLFEKSHSESMSRRIDIWLAWLQGRVSAGAIVLRQGQHAVSWHAVTRESDFKARPANALQMAILQDACASDFRWYDLNPSGGHEGSTRFKLSMGAQEHAVPLMEIGSNLPSRAAAVLSRLARKIKAA